MRSHRHSIVAVLAASLFASSVQSAACADVISTQQYLTAIDREATRARVDAVLARDEVRGKLEQYGVDPIETEARLAALTDQELQQLATDLENMPAGGDLLAVVGIAFIVLLILELTGVIDIFSKI
ncbi:MAG TPA: PA2779 family protein [Gammaproteobacteria bacterium]|nr:PA2779 family protein [Gammaproteobacteria bacterium]